MKRVLTIVAALFMVAAVSVSASAEMVNAGLVDMEKANFERLQGLVSGGQSFDSKAPVAEKQAVTDTGLVKMSAADLAAIEDYVAGRAEFKASTGTISGEKMVSAGLIELPASDLVDMKRMVQKGHADRLALLSSALDR